MILRTADIFTQKITNCFLTNKGKIMKKNILPVIIAFVLAVLLMVPLANPVLYVLFGIDIAAIIALALICFIKKFRENLLNMIPRFVLFWTTFNMGIAISITRNILTTDTLVNQNKISTLIFGINTSNTSIIVSGIIFLCLTITGLINGSIGKKRFNEIWKKVKDEGNKEIIEFYGNLNGSYRFLNGAFIFEIFITAVIVFGGTLTGSLNYGKPITDCIKESIMLGIGTSIIFQALNVGCNFIVLNCFDRFEQ